MSKSFSCLVFACALTACSPKIPINPAAAHLPDYSGEVERIQGEDPREYFIGNMPALNAVDADGDGMWDDIQARLAIDPIIAQADPRAIRLMVEGHQARMLYRSRADTRADAHKKHALGVSCLLATTRADVYWLRIADAVSDAVYVSKPRVLASLYADGLASGGVFKSIPPSIASCELASNHTYLSAPRFGASSSPGTTNP